MPERLECEVLQKDRFMNTLTFTFFTWRPSGAYRIDSDTLVLFHRILLLLLLVSQ